MPKTKKALITGLTGQDGSYMAELLVSKGYKVYGFVRRLSNPNQGRIVHLLDKIEIVSGDMTDFVSIYDAIKKIKPDEIYNFAAQSFVPVSWEQPYYTGEVDSLGVVHFLESIRMIDKKIRFYQASSSEMFGKVQTIPQNEKTPFYPRSPYAISKLMGHWLTINYRESYGLFSCSGISFNHESPRRGREFVTRKISHSVARIKLGIQKELRLGNTNAKRDWGFAGDYVKAMWLMLQQNKPDDYIIASGETHKVREFMELAFEHAGLDYRKHVKDDKNFYRKNEVDLLIGDYSKIRKKLGWKPEVGFKELVKMMVDADIEMISNGKKQEAY